MPIIYTIKKELGLYRRVHRKIFSEISLGYHPNYAVITKPSWVGSSCVVIKNFTMWSTRHINRLPGSGSEDKIKSKL